MEQQWQIGISGWRNAYIRVFHSKQEIDGNNENFLTFWYRQTRLPPRHISNSSLFPGWKNILNFPSSSKTARSYEISLKLYLERCVWRDGKVGCEKKRTRNAFTSIIRVEFEDKRKRANRANGPGPIITVISMKTSLSGLTGSYRGEGRERIIGRERIRFSKLMVVKRRLNGKWSNECRYTYQALSLHLPPCQLGLISYEWLDRGFGAKFSRKFSCIEVESSFNDLRNERLRRSNGSRSSRRWWR